MSKVRSLSFPIDYKCYLVLLVSTIVFLLLFSSSTSPFYVCPELYDSGVFQLIGKSWAQGKIPYVDIWDTKGPFVFFINAIGYWGGQGKIGVFVLQDIFLFVSMAYAFKIISLEYNKRTSLLLTLALMLYFANTCEGGNNVEEYVLPFLFISFYNICRWLRKIENERDYSHTPCHSLIYGVVLGISLATRLTDALSVCGALLVVYGVILYHRLWKNLYLNIIYFVLGFALIYLPFVIYFAWKHALYDMWFSSFLFNFSYLSSHSIHFSTLYQLGAFIKSYLFSFLLLSYSLLLFFDKKNRVATLTWFSSSFFLSLWFLTGMGFAHYGTLALPYIAILFVIVKHRGLQNKKSYKPSLWIMVSIIFVTFLFETKTSSRPFQDQSDFLSDYKVILRSLPEQGKKNFIAVNCLTDIYLYFDLDPCYKYISMQTFGMSISSKIAQDIKDTFKTDKAEWILVGDDPFWFYDVCGKNYQLVRQYKELKLYKLINHSHR